MSRRILYNIQSRNKTPFPTRSNETPFSATEDSTRCKNSGRRGISPYISAYLPSATSFRNCPIRAFFSASSHQTEYASVNSRIWVSSHGNSSIKRKRLFLVLFVLARIPCDDRNDSRRAFHISVRNVSTTGMCIFLSQLKSTWNPSVRAKTGDSSSPSTTRRTVLECVENKYNATDRATFDSMGTSSSRKPSRTCASSRHENKNSFTDVIVLPRPAPCKNKMGVSDIESARSAVVDFPYPNSAITSVISSELSSSEKIS